MFQQFVSSGRVNYLCNPCEYLGFWWALDYIVNDAVFFSLFGVEPFIALHIFVDFFWFLSSVFCHDLFKQSLDANTFSERNLLICHFALYTTRWLVNHYRRVWQQETFSFRA